MEFPVLYHKGKKDKIYIWKISTDNETIITEAGLDGGKLTITKQIATSKNIGKSNETSPSEQAVLEAQASWKLKRDVSYFPTKEECITEEILLPMLADKYVDYADKITGYTYIQRKLDGIRALAYWKNNQIELLSRKGNIFTTVPHINKELEGILPKNRILDGEIYKHGLNFQQISELVKKERPGNTSLEYHIYDTVMEGTWEDRYQWLESNIRPFKMNHIFLEHTFKCIDDSEILKFHKQFRMEKYEGSIIRLPFGKYLKQYRSKDLLKLKDFDDAEFKIVGVTTGVGRFRGSAIWICETLTGNKFNVVSKGTITYKQELYKNSSKYIGRELTVRYLGLSEDGIPQKPVGIGFRLD